MFDPNAMLELQHLARDRYQRAGGGGASKVYMTTQAYDLARGWKELSPFAQACIEMLHRYRQTCEIARSHYAVDCMATKEGFYDETGSVPF